MFGMLPGLPDMSNMVKQIEEFKSQFERLVSAVETIQRNQALIMEALAIEPVESTTTVAQIGSAE